MSSRASRAVASANASGHFREAGGPIRSGSARASQRRPGMQTANDWGSAVVVDTALAQRAPRVETRTCPRACPAPKPSSKAASACWSPPARSALPCSYRQANHISRQASHITDLSAQVQKYRHKRASERRRVGSARPQPREHPRGDGEGAVASAASRGGTGSPSRSTRRAAPYGSSSTTASRRRCGRPIQRTHRRRRPEAHSVRLVGLDRRAPGWFNAQDCGKRDQGLSPRRHGDKPARRDGVRKQDRFVIVVPKDSGKS